MSACQRVYCLVASARLVCYTLATSNVEMMLDVTFDLHCCCMLHAAVGKNKFRKDCSLSHIAMLKMWHTNMLKPLPVAILLNFSFPIFVFRKLCPSQNEWYLQILPAISKLAESFVTSRFAGVHGQEVPSI